MSHHNTLQQARHFVAAGFSVIPLRLDGSKAPAISSWKEYQERQPTDDELQSWFADNRAGIGLVCGYNGLFVIDIDDFDVADPLCAALEQVWPEWWKFVAVVDTPRPGRQLLIRTSKPPGNLKLAHRRDEDGAVRAFIETRGVGGYIVAVGSPVGVHPNGTPYQHAAGCEIAELPVVDDLHFEKFLAVGRLFNAVELEKAEFQRQPYDGPPRPGDVFNLHANWNSMLKNAGWVLDHERDGVSYWRRPGKEAGHGAQLGYFRDDQQQPLLGVFSTSLSYGPADDKAVRLLTKFDFLAHARHGGDYSQAALDAADTFPAALESAQRAYRQQSLAVADYLDYSYALRLSEIEARDIEWLWPDFLLVAEINLYSGEQGLGKSFMVNDLVARVTTGRPWPDGTKNGHGPSSCLMLLAEDDPASVVKPRQQAAGGQMEYISILPPVIGRADGADEVISLRDDLQIIEHELEQFARNGCPPCRLIVIDPLSAFLGKTDGNDWAATRVVTTKLSQFAQRHKVAILIVHHFGKDTKRDGIGRSLGSTTFTAAARVFLTGYRDRDDRERRILYRDKSNVAPTGLAMAYRLGKPTGSLGQNIPVIWEPQPFAFDPCEAMETGSNKRDARRQFLSVWLEQHEYPTPVTELYEAAHQFGFGERFVRKVASELGIETSNRGEFGGQYHFVRTPCSTEISHTQQTVDHDDHGEVDAKEGTRRGDDISTETNGFSAVSPRSTVLSPAEETVDHGDRDTTAVTSESADHGERDASIRSVATTPAHDASSPCSSWSTVSSVQEQTVDHGQNDPPDATTAMPLADEGGGGTPCSPCSTVLSVPGQTVDHGRDNGHDAGDPIPTQVTLTSESHDESPYSSCSTVSTVQGQTADHGEPPAQHTHNETHLSGDGAEFVLGDQPTSDQEQEEWLEL